ncbi:MAG TPA: M6 family metalloprotease domain-containing protein [Gemmataceae bacterium]|nr:M6 family metalloprotease domain-containing protein [Gemmataceae bacterium]
MARSLCRLLFALALLGGVPWLLTGPDLASAQDVKKADPLADFRTVETAITARISKAAPAATAQPAYLGIHVSNGDGDRVIVAHLQADSPAVRAGVKEGDILTQIAGQAVRAPEDLKQSLTGKGPGEKLTLGLLRQQERLEITATLAPPSQPLTMEQSAGPKGKGGWDTRRMTAWKKNFYRLAVILIEYPDQKGNEAVKPKDWEESLFSCNKHTGKNATGQQVYGSLNDFFLEQSYGTFHVEGKVFPFVKVSKKRTEYGQTQGANRTALLTEAMDKLLARDGKDALKDFDGVFFMFAGGRVPGVARGSLYWPHRSSVTHQGKRWPYFICPEGGGRMGNISVFCHEFGHMVGLPDLYARPENPGSEGLGQWCLMSNQVGNGRPQHLSAWCKEQLGWLQPVTIDPTTKQKLILSPVQKSPKECFKVLARADGSEYYLLENRTAKGFDASLPAHGLLIWRVTRGRPLLEESHGVAGPAGPRMYPSLVPFPSKANDAFTPYTIPSSRSQLGGGLPVHITNIQRLPDGRITFYVGWEFF